MKVLDMLVKGFSSKFRADLNTFAMKANVIRDFITVHVLGFFEVALHHNI